GPPQTRCGRMGERHPQRFDRRSEGDRARSRQGSLSHEGGLLETVSRPGVGEERSGQASGERNVSNALANDLERYLWNEQAAWSQTADRLRDVRSRSRSIVMMLTIAGAVLQTFAGTGPAFRTAAGIAGTVALSLAAGIAGFFMKPENTQRWLRARSVAEGIKSEFYAYRASADPYTGPDALQLLQESIRKIVGFAKDLAGQRARTSPKPKPMPDKLDQASYLSQRLDGQIDTFYLRQAKRNADRAAIFRNAEIGLALLAA